MLPIIYKLRSVDLQTDNKKEFQKLAESSNGATTEETALRPEYQLGNYERCVQGAKAWTFNCLVLC